MAGESGDDGGWGRVEVAPPAADRPGRGPPAGGVRELRYTWHPPRDVAEELPAGFTLAFDCLTGADGVRRFAPALPARAFAVTAGLAGYAVLAARHGLTPEQRASYHATRLVYQKAPGLREHLDRAFARESDLYAAGGGPRDGHVLPPALGLDAAGRGDPWTPAVVMARGREAAAATGRANPDPAAVVRLGLRAAARLNPLDPAALTADGGLALVRLALFDLGPDPGAVGGDVAAAVEGRLLAALGRHAGDDTAAFRRWFFADPADLVHAVAKQKTGGGTVPRGVARRVFLDLVFRSYTYVGDCVHRLANAFAAALPEPLTGDERAAFAGLYRCQPHLGGLPLVLLHDRFGFVREALLDVWDAPADAGRVGVLLRLLDYYAEMAGPRRAADRENKDRGGRRNDRGGVSRVFGLDPDRDVAASAGDEFRAVAEALRQTRGAVCDCGTTAGWRAVLVGDPTVDPAVIEDGCERCGYQETFEVPWAAIRAAARPG